MPSTFTLNQGATDDGLSNDMSWTWSSTLHFLPPSLLVRMSVVEILVVSLGWKTLEQFAFYPSSTKTIITALYSMYYVINIFCMSIRWGLFATAFTFIVYRVMLQRKLNTKSQRRHWVHSKYSTFRSGLVDICIFTVNLSPKSLNSFGIHRCAASSERASQYRWSVISISTSTNIGTCSIRPRSDARVVSKYLQFSALSAE